MTSPRGPIAPPYLLTAADRHRTGATVTGDTGAAAVEVAARGTWSPRLGDQVSAAVRMCLAGPCASMILDLRELDDTQSRSVPFWLAMWRETRFANAPAQIAFCVPAPTALSRHFQFLPGPQPRVFATMPEARTALAGRLPRADRLQARLEPRPDSVRAARDLVTRACRAWQLPDQLQDTWLIVSELAANAVEHARTDFIVTVSRKGTRLHVAIHDCLGAFPQLGATMLAGPQTSFGSRGRGLRLVHTIAAAWGTIPTQEGKVVWAAVK